MTLDARKLERVQNFLFSSQEEMQQAGLPASEQERLLRLRASYSHWLANPRLSERDMAGHIQQVHRVGQSAAYNDLRILKALLGSLNSATTEYYRWLFLQRCEEGFEMAREANDGAGDAKAFASVLSAFLKGTQLDKEQAQTIDYSQIVPQPFELTSDPTAAGLTADPTAHAKARRLLARWKKELTQPRDAQFEELKTQPEEKPAPLYAEIHKES